MQIEIFLALLVFAFTTSITPGPNNMMLFASGVNFGFVRTIPHMCGIGVGFLVLLLAYPLTGGLLPHVARNIYGMDQTGLGTLIAIAGAVMTALSELIGSENVKLQ